MNLLQLTSTDMVADVFPCSLASGINLELSLQLLISIGCTYQASLLLNLSQSIPENFSFVGVTSRLWPSGLWNPPEIVSVNIKLNSIDISRNIADAISALKPVYLGRSLRVVTHGKGVIHKIPYAKHI